MATENTLLVLNDAIEVNTSDAPVTINLDNPNIKQNVDSKESEVYVNQKYNILPAYSYRSTDFTIPDSVLSGIFANMDGLRTSLLDTLAGEKAAILDEMTYEFSNDNGILKQRLLDLDAKYVSTGKIDEYALITELSNQVIAKEYLIDRWTQGYIQDRTDWDVPFVHTDGQTYTNDSYLQARWALDTIAEADASYPLSGLNGTGITDGGGGIVYRYETDITSQDIYDNSVRVGNSLASFTNNLQVFANNQTAYASELSGMTAAVGDMSMSNYELSSIFIGPPVLDSDIYIQDATPVPGVDETYQDLLDRVWIRQKIGTTCDATCKTTIIAAYRANEIAVEPTTGWYREFTIIDGVYKYFGPILGWKRMEEFASGAISSATRFITDETTGAITGWGFGDGTDVDSTFTIKANNFYLENSDIPGYRPFSVDGTNVTFNGVVDFTNTNVAGGYPGTTTINGGLVEANTINAEKINTVGLIAEDIYTTELYGKYIHGAIIVGSVIKSSWIDYITTGDLTNWQYYTPATVPSTYQNNFAKDNETSALIVDSQGYVRLPGSSTLYGSSFNFSLSIGQSNSSTDQVASYNSYTINTVKRCVPLTPRITIGSLNILSITFVWNYTSNSAQFYVGGNKISISVGGMASGFAFSIIASVYVNDDYRTDIRLNSDTPTASASFTVYGISFTIYNSSSGIHLKFTGQTNTLISSHSSKNYIISNFSRPSTAGPGNVTVSLPQVKYTQ